MNKLVIRQAGLAVALVVSVFLASACRSDGASSVTPVPASAEEKNYAAWFAKTINEINATNDSFDEALENFRKDPSDNYQLLIVAREIVRYSIIYEEASQHIAPPSLSEVHATLVAGIGEYNTVSNIASGKVTGDLSKMFQYIDRGKGLIFEAEKQFEQWNATRLPFDFPITQ